MVSRKTKELFYSTLGPFMKINGFIYKFFRAPKKGFVKVHLGPGQRNYLKGFINVDANIISAKLDVWADLTNPLPFHDNTVDVFYSHHVIEHLSNLDAHFKEVYRCLKPGGVYRVGGPSGDSAIKKFFENDKNWFTDFPDNRKSVGGKFENMIFCRNEHLTILTFSFLKELCLQSGLEQPLSLAPTKETNYPDFFKECLLVEHEWDFETPHTLIIETKKPL